MQEGTQGLLPEISFTIKRGDDAQTGDFSLDCVGFGIHQCWIYATMFGATKLFNHQNMFDGAFDAQFTLQFLVSIVCLASTLLFYGFTDNRYRDKIPPRVSVVFAAIITFAGSLMLIIPGLSYEVATALEIASGVLTGVGSATLIISWGVRFSRRDLFSIAVNSIVAIAFAYFLYSFVLAALPSPFGGIAASVLPLLELPLLLHAPQRNFFTDSYSKHFKPLPVHMGKFLLAFGVPMLIFGFALGLLRHLCIQHAADLSAQSSVVAIAFAIVILFGRVVLFPSREGSWGLDFRGLVPLIAVAIAFIPTATSTNAEAASTLILVTYLCFETLMWTYFGEISQAFRISPLLVFGIGRGLAAVGTLVSSGLIVEMRYGIARFSGEEGLILFLILTLIVAFTLLPNKNSFRHIVVLGKDKKAQASQDAFDFDEPDELGMGSDGKAAPGKNEDGFEHDTTLTSRDIDEVPGKKTEPVIVKLPANAMSGVDAVAHQDGSVAAGGASTHTDTAKVVAAKAAQPLGGATQKPVASETGAPHAKPGYVAVRTTPVQAKPSQVPIQGRAGSPAVQRTASQQASQPTMGHAPTTSTVAAAVAISQPRPAYTASQLAMEAASAQRQPAATQQTVMPTPGATYQQSAARAAMMGGRGGNDPYAGPKKQKKGWFRKKCEAVSNTYMLSAREEEVLFYLAKGFNAGHIQEKLYISEGTAKTHMRHIYRKLDVHSQQALIRLVESTEIEEDF